MEGEPQPPLELPTTESIDGWPLPLASMPYSELMLVYEACCRRSELAIAEGQLVAKYIDLRFPQGPENAA